VRVVDDKSFAINHRHFVCLHKGLHAAHQRVDNFIFALDDSFVVKRGFFYRYAISFAMQRVIIYLGALKKRF
jgi:hypothetical protein